MDNEIFIDYYDCLDILKRMFPGELEAYFEIPDTPEALDKWDDEHPYLRKLWNQTLFHCYDKRKRARPSKVRSGELIRMYRGAAKARKMLGIGADHQMDRYCRALERLRKKARDLRPA